jgi:CheY-like chemotaxis protein
MTLAGKTILIADDEDFIRRHIARRLESHGFRVLEAGEGASVLGLLEQNPDVVLLDVKMPGLDGLTITRKMREDPRYSVLPVILLSARAQKEDIEAGLSAGATAYLTKPVTFSHILEKINEILTTRNTG